MVSWDVSWCKVPGFPTVDAMSVDWKPIKTEEECWDEFNDYLASILVRAWRDGRLTPEPAEEAA